MVGDTMDCVLPLDRKILTIGINWTQKRNVISIRSGSRGLPDLLSIKRKGSLIFFLWSSYLRTIKGWMKYLKKLLWHYSVTSSCLTVKPLQTLEGTIDIDDSLQEIHDGHLWFLDVSLLWRHEYRSLPLLG